MPIEIVDFPEPLTPASSLSLADPILIKSKAYHQVLHELRRYCNGDSSGRSFLIAGHRGSGKTTLVLSAFEKVLRESEPSLMGSRPLRVQLLGPSLLPDLSEKDLAEPGKGAASGEKKLTEFENVLVQITLALYRAVAREFTEAYEKRMLEAAPAPDVQLMSALLEAPGQLVLELDEYPGKARLREFWRRADALPYGLLSRTSVIEDKARTNAGIRELVALCSVSEAYRRISGTIQAKSEDKTGEEDATTKTSDIDFKGKELYGPLITLLTGGAVATGVAAINPDRIGIAVVAGILTALASAISSKRSTIRSRKRSAAREDLFLPDLSVATLDRVLPVLLERVRAAGLAPVFIIDELDKVANLSERIPQMVKRLKKLVAESAFFCFLTDRRYFEEMRARNVVTPYSVEYTYFTNYVFVTFAHTDLHAYLAQVLRIAEATPRQGLLSPQEDEKEVAADYVILPYVLLHNAQMHPIDLRRQLGEVRGANKSVSLPVGSLRSAPYRKFELMIQVAIELLLEEDPMVSELSTDPTFRRLAHDALYFISRQWETVNELRFDRIGKKKFRTYLIDRMKTEWTDSVTVTVGASRAPETETRSGPDAKAAANTSPLEGRTRPRPLLQPSFTDDQMDFLFDYVHRLALLLEDPAQIRILALRKPPGRFDARVLDSLKVDEKVGPLPLLERKAKETFRWRYNRAGRPTSNGARTSARVHVTAPDAAVAVVESPAASTRDDRDDIDLIEDFNAKILELSNETVSCGMLGAGFGVISTSPAWPSVLESVQRLKTISGEYSQRSDDSVIVQQFADLLRRSASLISAALCGAWVIGFLQSNVLPNRVFRGLQILSETLSLKSLPEEQVLGRVKDFAAEAFQHLSFGPPIWLDLNYENTVDRWAATLKERFDAIDRVLLHMKVDQITVSPATWEFWQRHLQSPEVRPDFETVVLAAQGKGPSHFLRIPIAEMTAREWSAAFYAALVASSPRTPGSPPEVVHPDIGGTPIPLWLALVALDRLGFGARIEIALTTPPSPLATYDLSRLQEAIRFNVPANPRQTRQALAIVSKEGAESEKWKPGRECAGLVLRAPELLRLASNHEQVQDLLFRWLGVQRIVFDWSGASPEKLTSLVSLLAEIDYVRPLTGFSTRFIPVMLPPLTSPMIPLPSPWRRIPTANSLDDLASAIHATQL